MIAPALLCSLAVNSTNNLSQIAHFSVIGVDELIAVPFIADLELDQPMFLANSVLWYRLVRNPGIE
ncbi:MAG: hypothetical protein GFH24_608378n55 [Chloroflexi bacterium AL-N5]|nr:hypothetical protein [Chloroflexi bacterium AL-N5]